MFTITAVVCVLLYSEGVTIGAHRLYAHKSFTATPLLRALLILLQTGAGQVSSLILGNNYPTDNAFIGIQ